MTDDTEVCDRCGATILMDTFERPRPFNFAFDVSEPDAEHAEYEQEQRVLCSGCEEDLLEWIDEGDIDRSDCVDLPKQLEAAMILTRAANTLNQTADVLQEELDDA